MVKVNGKSLDIAGKTLTEYLAATSYDSRQIAIEHNEEILPKTQYDKTVLADGDIVEIVQFMGGGQKSSSE